MHQPVHELFRRAAGLFPDHPAVEGQGQTLSYRHLDRSSDLLAERLLRNGLRPSSLVGILVGRSVDVISSILAVLKAGGAFVPVDPNFQVTRLDRLLTEAGPALWLTDPDHVQRLQELQREHGRQAEILPLGEGESRGADTELGLLPGTTPLGPEDLCYVYFTSGSTGRPKGIAGRFKAIDHYINWMTAAFDVGPGSRFSQLISPAWDGFLLDMFVPLSIGGTVCVPDGREVILDGGRLRRWLHDRKLSFLHCTPSLFRSLLSQDLTAADFPELRCCFLVGEALPPSDVKKWYAVFGERVQLVNLYGPSETTLTKLFYRVKPEDGESLSIPIGQPMPGAKVVVVDEEGRPCSAGRLGEIYIRTPYRALGYLNQPELTAQVFVRNPFSERVDDIVYKTGDLGRLRPDGNLEFEGRRDGQVKIRGIRIEMAPIESFLRSHDAVADVAVADRLDVNGNKFLCAYVVLKRDVSTDQLRRFLAGHLAEVMVPSAFVFLESLPRTLTGKVDRHRLPSPGEGCRPIRDVVAPRTEVESRLCAIFRELLALPEVGIRESFFELGGHSLLTTMLVSRVRSAFGVELPLLQVFQTQTVEQLAQVVVSLQADSMQDSKTTAAIPRIPTTLGSGWPLSFSQERLWIVDQLEVNNPFNNICSAVRLTGGLDLPALAWALGEVTARHEALRTTFHRRGDQPLQFVEPVRRSYLPLIDLETLPELQRGLEVLRLATGEMDEPFDLASGPLLRCKLFKLTSREHVMTCVVHHIAADWWSLVILVRELTELYSRFCRGAVVVLPELPIQYKDFALWQRQRLTTTVIEEQLAYWRWQLAGAPPYLSLALDHPRPAIQSHRGAQSSRLLPRELSEAARKLGLAQGCTLFMVLLTAYQVLLHHFSGADDLIVNTPVSGRNRGETEGLIGFFVNTLLLRARFDGDPAFRELLATARETVQGAYAHQDVPVDRVVEELAPARQLSYSPFLQASINLVDRDPLEGVGFTELAVTTLDLDGAHAQYDLNLVLFKTQAGLQANLQYRTALFQSSTIALLLEQFEQLVRQAVENPEARLRALRKALVELEEKRRLSEKARLQQAGFHFPQKRQRGTSAGV